MYEPKFKIGDIVKSERYEFENAIIIGFKVYPDGKWREDFKDLQKFLGESNNADYDLIYNKDGVTFYETFSEEHLKESE